MKAKASNSIFAIMMVAGMSITKPCTAQAQDSFNPAPLQAQAQAGDPVAAFQLATLDYVGLGVVQDYIGAATLLKSAAQAGNADAACELGFLYQTGSFAQGPPPPDPADAAIWYEKSAAAGNPCGAFALGALYQWGQGVAQDTTKAAALFAQAAAQGLTQDPGSFPLEQLQRRFYGVALRIAGQTSWVDLVSAQTGAGTD